MDATTVAIDLAKDVFQVALANRAGRVVDRQRFTRRQFERFVDTLVEDTDVIMESCGTSHYWGRRMQARASGCALAGPVRAARTSGETRRTAPTPTHSLKRPLRRDSSRAGEDRSSSKRSRRSIACAPSGRRRVWPGSMRCEDCWGNTATRSLGARTVLRRVTAILGTRTPGPRCCVRRSRSSSTKSTDSRRRSPARSPARADRPRASRRDTAPNDPWRRRADRDRARGFRRAHSCVSSRTRVRQLAGVDAA